MQRAQPTQPPSRNEAPFPRRFRLRHPRSRSGCLTCRRRKKKCDETPGRCRACRRGGLDCHWPDGISANKEQSSECGPSETTTMITMPVTMDLASTEQAGSWHLTSASPLLLQYYVIETASRLGVTKSSAINPFLGCVLPVAFSEDIMMHTVLALAGAHMTFKASDATPIRTSMRQHYGYAVRGLAKGLFKGNVKESRCLGQLMLVLALLCHYEVTSFLTTI